MTHILRFLASVSQFSYLLCKHVIIKDISRAVKAALVYQERVSQCEISGWWRLIKHRRVKC